MVEFIKELKETRKELAEVKDLLRSLTGKTPKKLAPKGNPLKKTIKEYQGIQLGSHAKKQTGI